MTFVWVEEVSVALRSHRHSLLISLLATSLSASRVCWWQHRKEYHFKKYCTKFASTIRVCLNIHTSSFACLYHILFDYTCWDLISFNACVLWRHNGRFTIVCVCLHSTGSFIDVLVWYTLPNVIFIGYIIWLRFNVGKCGFNVWFSSSSTTLPYVLFVFLVNINCCETASVLEIGF